MNNTKKLPVSAEVPVEEIDPNVRRLCCAVILRAVQDYRNEYARSEVIYIEREKVDAQRSAEEWLFEDDRTYPYSYLWCCNVTGLDPKRLRGAIKSLSTEFRVKDITIESPFAPIMAPQKSVPIIEMVVPKFARGIGFCELTSQDIHQLLRECETAGRH